MPDNSIYRRRQAARNGQRPPRPGMGDYIDPLYYRAIRTQGGAGQQGDPGPLSYPTVESPLIPGEEDVPGLLWRIIKLLEDLPQRQSAEARLKFVISPREKVPFIASTANVTLAAGATVAIVTQLVPERQTGYLQRVGVAASPLGSLSSITWDVRINSFIVPNFSSRIFEANTIDELLDFEMELTQARNVQLVATNNGAAPIDVTGVLQGWWEFMALYKPYGSESASGIS